MKTTVNIIFLVKEALVFTIKAKFSKLMRIDSKILRYQKRRIVIQSNTPVYLVSNMKFSGKKFCSYL